jgi:hypothetical protein
MVHSKKVSDCNIPVNSNAALDFLCLMSYVVYVNSEYVDTILYNKNPRRKLRKLIFATKDEFSADQLDMIAEHRRNMKK